MHFGIGTTKSHLEVPFVLASLMLSGLVPACGGDSSPPTTASASIKNENNYTSTGKLTIPHVETAPGADLNICWPALVSDLLCHPIAPATDIESVTFLKIPNMTEEQIATQFASGTFDSGVVEIYRSFKVDKTSGSTCGNLGSFKLGTAMLSPATDYVADPAYKYMLLFAQGITPGVGSKSMLFLDPVPTSAITQVAAPTGCGILDFEADLTTPTPVAIPAAGPYEIEWTSLTKDGLGNKVIYQNIDSLMVGFYELTVAQLQDKALDYDRIAASLYTLPIAMGARKADLTLATTSAGVPFAGFNQTNGVWAVGLLCSTCQIPAPVAVAILNPL